MIIADLQEQSLRGICLFFLRNSKKTVITGQNIVNVGLPMTSGSALTVILILLGSVLLRFRMQYGTIVASLESIDCGYLFALLASIGDELG